jgi:hypothetical protein
MRKNIPLIFLVMFNLGFATQMLGQEAPDYAQLQFWAAHPDKEDPSDRVPQTGLATLKENKNVDVFFLHPTTYTKGKPKNNWNASVLDENLREKTKNGTILHQASIFNGAGKVYAPFYRQAHLQSYFTKDTLQAKHAFNIAYTDVKSAFMYYLENVNQGRPFILASHSQGTTHAQRLIKEVIDKNERLQEQLVVAYLVGMPVMKDAFDNIPVCEDPIQTSCFCAWRTFKEGYTPKKRIVGDDIAVVNPILWTTSKEKVDKSRNKGSVLRNYDAGFTQHLVGAQVHNGILWVNKPKFPGSFLLISKNYHIADFNLFYESVRANSISRVNSYHQKHNRQ